MRTTPALLGATILVCLASSPALAWTVTLDTGGTSYLYLLARHAGTNNSSTDYPGTLPFVQGSLQTSAHPDTYAASDYDLSNDGFDITFDHSRSSATNEVAQAQGYIYFSVDAAVDYELSGSYSAVDATGRRVYLRVELYDMTLAQLDFQSYQYSQNTPNESFVLGGTGGDAYNANVGSLTGTLAAGHDYRLYYNTHIYDETLGSAGATASGSVSFALVPEPGTGVLSGLGLLVLGLRRRATRS